ncbi:hypothetical protein [Kribbella sp. DT2]|uniref:hypothetical protein n=1 Tax=Kribbella sp. DT2 TaxID=3393427 RepID=UPI003CECEA91
MSEAVRTELADAVSAIDGISIAPYFRQATKAGSGFVRLDRIEYPNTFGGEAYWQVYIVLPADIATAEKRADELTPLLYNALADHLVVTSIQPQSLALDSGALPVLTVTGHREN